MENHLPSRLYFAFGWSISVKKKNRQKVRRSSMAHTERGVCKGMNFKEIVLESFYFDWMLYMYLNFQITFQDLTWHVWIQSLGRDSDCVCMKKMHSASDPDEPDHLMGIATTPLPIPMRWSGMSYNWDKDIPSEGMKSKVNRKYHVSFFRLDCEDSFDY